MKYLRHFSLFTFVLLIVQVKANAQASVDLKPFYFPYSNFFTPVVYQFVDQLKPQNVQYWRMQTQVIDGDTILTTKTYDHTFTEVERVVEKITPQGSQLTQMSLMIDGKLRQTQLGQKQVYRWHQPIGQKLAWDINYVSSYGRETLLKQRAQLGKARFTSRSGKTHQAIKFKDHYTRSIQKGSQADALSLYQYSIYGKGLGTVEYQRFYLGKMILHYKLVRVINAQDWTRQKNRKNRK